MAYAPGDEAQMEPSGLIDSILDDYRNQLGSHHERYRGHAQRVYHYTCHGLRQQGIDPGPMLNQIEIAAAFHDLLFVTEARLDYLGPSSQLALAYLAQLGLPAASDRVERMIVMHHKLTPYRARDAEVVEAFRRADLVDVMGVPGQGVDMKTRREVRAVFAMNGFRGFVCGRLLAGMLRHPLKPLPMLKW